jgi:hypothetical protein
MQQTRADNARMQLLEFKPELAAFKGASARLPELAITLLMLRSICVSSGSSKQK